MTKVGFLENYFGRPKIWGFLLVVVERIWNVNYSRNLAKSNKYLLNAAEGDAQILNNLVPNSDLEIRSKIRRNEQINSIIVLGIAKSKFWNSKIHMPAALENIQVARPL